MKIKYCENRSKDLTVINTTCQLQIDKIYLSSDNYKKKEALDFRKIFSYETSKEIIDKN